MANLRVSSLAAQPGNAGRLSAHIALLLPDLRAGGAQRVFMTLARAFLAKGVRVDIVVGLAEGDLLLEVPSGARLLPLCARLPAFGHLGLALVMLLRLIRYLRQHQPDALLSTLSGTNLVAATARRMARVPTRLVLREASRLANLRYHFYIALMRRAYRWADAIVALTPEMQEELGHVLGLPPGHVVQIPNPVDFEVLRQDANSELPENFDVAQPYVLAVGRLAPPKDYITLVRAFSHVVRAVPVKLVILGEGPDRPQIEAQIRALSLDGQVELRGFDANPYRWMARAALFVLSSHWEGYPNVIAEAQALEIPVVATEYDSSAFSLVCPPGRVVPVADEAALGNAILALLDAGHQDGGSYGAALCDKRENSKVNRFSNDSTSKYLALLTGPIQR